MNISKAGKTARVKLADVLIRAGYNRWKVLDAVKFPSCTGFSWNCFAQNGRFKAKPDDDFRLQYEKIFHGERVTFPGSDKQRNVGWYEGAVHTFNEGRQTHNEGERINTKILFVGETKIHSDVFDGWGSGYQLRRWSITFTYSDGSVVKADGGKDMEGTGRPVDKTIPDYYKTGPHYRDYYENGWAIVPPALDWTMPECLELGTALVDR